MLRTAPFNLGAGGTLLVPQAAIPGKTYRIEANQVPGFPLTLGPPIAHATVIGCNPFPNGSFNVGFALQYYTGNPTTWLDTDCQPNIASYDPNDKSAQPLGYGAQHYINRGIPLDYKVRFQNTGNDTAFNIVIIDTLSSFVDVTTLRMKSASHPYTWELSGTGVLRVTFADILLVDSLTNESLSHGFFTYYIEQKTNLPIGAVINNQAAIYFDYNSPIFTNTTFHTISENFVPLILVVSEVEKESLKIDVYPNPFSYMTTIEIEGESFDEVELEVIDVTGRLVKNLRVKDTQRIELYRDWLIQGIYFYRIKGDGEMISSGKLIVR